MFGDMDANVMPFTSCSKKLYHSYWPTIGPYFPGYLFLEYFPNSNNKLNSYLQIGLELFTNNIGLITVLFWRFYFCQSRHGHILRSLEAPFDLSEMLVLIVSDMSSLFYFLPIHGKKIICLRLHIFISAFMQRVLYSYHGPSLLPSILYHPYYNE